MFPLLLTFAGLSPALLESYEKPWDPFTLRVQETVCLETMDLSDGTLEARGGGGWEGKGKVCGRDGIARRVAVPWLHLPAALRHAWVWGMEEKLAWLCWPPMYLVSSCFSKERGCLPLWGLILPFDQQIFIGDLHYTLETEKQTGLSPVQRGEPGTKGLWGQFQATQTSQAVQAPPECAA